MPTPHGRRMMRASKTRGRWVKALAEIRAELGPLSHVEDWMVYRIALLLDQRKQIP